MSLLGNHPRLQQEPTRPRITSMWRFDPHRNSAATRRSGAILDPSNRRWRICKSVTGILASACYPAVAAQVGDALPCTPRAP
jgi:hypothetical protein